MARARNIKPGLFKNEVLGVADPIYTLAFEGLWVLADRAGRLEDRPLRIKAEIFPYRAELNIESILEWLQKSGFITRYSHGENRYIEINNFAKHQNPHKNEVDSVIPPPQTKANTNTDEISSGSEKIGSARADSLIPDSLIPDSLSTQANACRENPSGCPPCPIEEIISIYHETLPTLPKQRVRTAARDEQIRARWKQFFSEGDFKDKEGGLDCFRWFFTEKVKASRFLMGQTQTNGRKPFVADLEWVTKQANFAKIIEGRYSNGA